MSIINPAVKVSVDHKNVVLVNGEEFVNVTYTNGGVDFYQVLERSIFHQSR